MIRNIVTAVALLAFGSIAEPAVAQMVGAQPDPSTASVGIADTVHVAPPTGEQGTDRASILAALDEVEPGGTVLFAPGTYLIGEFIRVSVPRVTLQGHSDGTTLRGCDPADYPEYQVQSLACNGLELAAGHQTVRNLTIEHAWHGMQIGCCRDQLRESARTGEGGPPRAQPGGHLIEDNRFRSVGTAMRVIGESSDLIVVRRNVFRNVFHALVINGGTAHVLDNDISSPEPGLVPAGASSGGAIGIFPAPPARECGGNVIAGNRIEGHPDGIGLSVGVPGTRCERNVVRDNTIIVRRVPILENPFGLRIGSESDSTVVGVPIRVINMVGVDGALPIPPTWEFEGETVIGGHRIEGNRVMGAEGIGIEIRRSSGNRIADNVVTHIERRDPFPGNLVNSADPEAWREANGSGIWISPGSNENEIRGDTFEDIASDPVVLEGDHNVVEILSSGDGVRDLGSGNRVTRSDSVQTRIIEVDGHAVHVYTSGWEHLERGQPVVVFEAGGFSTLDAWGDLPARLARETAVVAYDRAGRGRSEWDGQRPTLEHVTSRLRRILEVLDAPPPYIHVGHSIGGPLGLTFARQFPDEMAGLVLVDPMPPTADWLGAFDDIGVGRAGHDEFVELLSRAFAGAPEPLLIELGVVIGYLSDPEALPWSPPDLSVPVAVLLAGAGYEVPSDLPSTWDLDQQHQALLLRQVANYAEWTRTVPGATMIVANNSRHCIHCWDPELVVGAIRRVLYPDVRVQLRQAMAAEGISAIEPTYDALRSRYPDSHFDENRLELLGRELLGFGRLEAAIAVFELNAREYPKVVRPHESLGDAYRAAGRLDDARGSYERASQLAEASASARLPALRRKLERVEREEQRSRTDSSQDNKRR